MKKITFLFVLALLAAALQAQPLVTIQQIQTASAANLSNCIDSNSYVGDTVTVRGVVVMDAKVLDANGNQVNNAQAASGRNIWIQNGTGPFSGIDVFKATAGSTATTPDDILDLVAGDSVEIVGIVYNYVGSSSNFGPLGESELMPLSVTLIGSSTVQSTPVALADINDAARINKLSTGEQWEGVYVELTDLTVATVDPFSNNTRVSFNVVDASGNKINVSDRFMAGRMAVNSIPGTFVAPVVGDRFDTLRGVLAHSQNGCPGANGRGYELYPFKSEDYVRTAGFAAPVISTINRAIVTPTSSQAIAVTSDVTDVDGTVASVTLNYAVGLNNNSYQQVPMTLVSGTEYTGSIPAQADGAFVKYYISATDNQGLTAHQPTVPGNIGNPKFFFVRDNGTQIYDVQFTPYADGNSGYASMEVTLSGVVTGSAADLGYIFIQQEGQLGWGGLSLTGNASLATVAPGDKITVTGTIKEDFSMTRMESISNVTKNGTGTITALNVTPDSLATYKFSRNEAYEGMLVSLTPAAAGKKLYIVDKNADGSNFGEYRVGRDVFAPTAGCRVLAGRQTSSTFSSLNVSYVNDSTWATTDGVMNVPACAVNYGDSLESIQGIVYYAFSNMKLLPRSNADITGFSGANSATGDFTSASTALSADFTATSANATDYSWNFGDGNTGTGATANHVYAAAGAYNVTLTLTNACGNTTVTKGIEVVTSVDAAAAIGFTVAPNPARETVAVRLSKAAGTATVTVADLTGAVVTTRTFDAAQGTDLNVANLAAGVYLVQVATQQGTATHKLMIAR